MLSLHREKDTSTSMKQTCHEQTTDLAEQQRKEKHPPISLIYSLIFKYFSHNLENVNKSLEREVL